MSQRPYTRPVPHRQLTERGTSRTYATFVSATQMLSRDEIEDLEEDLQFFEQTGLIGIQMSRLLNALRPRSRVVTRSTAA